MSSEEQTRNSIKYEVNPVECGGTNVMCESISHIQTVSRSLAYLEESPERALFRTSGVSSAGAGTSGIPESTLDSLSETPSFSAFCSLSEV